MRNKSRKRLLHEQRVEIARLNREIDACICAINRARWEHDPTKDILYSKLVPLRDQENKYEMLFSEMSERIIRDIVRVIVSSNVMQITTDSMPELGATKVTFRLKFLVPENTDIKPSDVFKNVDRIDFREPEILFGGPHRGGEMFARQMYEERRALLKHEYSAMNWEGRQ